MRHSRQQIRPRALALQLCDRILGRGQTLITPGKGLPLVLASYPRGRRRFAAALTETLRFTLPSLPRALRESYGDVLAELPPVVVADLRARNECACLGHHHPRCTLPVAQQLAADSGRPVGEIDLAVDAIRDWRPTPLAHLAVHPAGRREKARFDELRFHTALLSVFLHELEHLAFPDRPEPDIRRRSDRFYRDALSSRLASERGVSFGLTVEQPA